MIWGLILGFICGVSFSTAFWYFSADTEARLMHREKR